MPNPWLTVLLSSQVIIIFCAGSTALESLFVEPGKLLAADSLVNRVASAFPAGAPFFVGWQIIVTGIHPFFELSLWTLLSNFSRQTLKIVVCSAVRIPSDQSNVSQTDRRIFGLERG